MAEVNDTTALAKATAKTSHKDAAQTAIRSDESASEPADKRDSASGRQVSVSTDDGGVLEMGEEEWRAAEKSLVRKLDMLLMPTLWILFIFNYLDRKNISQAKLSTFEKDLGLVGNEFNVAVSILNVGYMLMQLPSNMLLTLARPSLYLPFWTSLWSIVSAATASAKSFGHLVAIRFILGFVEAPFSPGAMYLLACWYPRRELALRMSIFMTGLPVATAFAGLIGAGVLGRLEGARGIAGWQWLFIIEGVGSFAFGLAAIALLPDFPDQKRRRWSLARCLITERERRVAEERIRRDRVSLPVTGENGVFHGLKLAVLDVRTWIFVLMVTANHAAYGFLNFFPTIVKGFKLGGQTETLLLTAPPYLVSALVVLYVGISSDKRNERGQHVAIPQIIACVGFIITAATQNGPTRYAAAFLYISGSFASLAPLFSWASSTLGETPQERACALAIVNLIGQLGNIVSPYFFPPEDGPRFLMANMLMMMCSAIVVVASAVMKVMLKRANAELLRNNPEAVVYTL
ncbi:hypothetical protein PpBr36_08881 [Pyricularia pennisetigena]|uniref:hypothetical protein n=1 Tax=Pyricularia pennisetigena TaxID=1578925 RepID=UPI00115416AE|nr:hypothetical protein PpBr36_08881 [Pyricularia pennisetigena]TLS24616.1 hypothetical protein PpBr36_08881 [Pyricularia pennisetigena]